MRKIFLSQLIVIITISLFSCVPQQSKTNEPREINPPAEKNTNEGKIVASKSVAIPKDGTIPKASAGAADSPSRVITLSKIGEKMDVKNGEVVNFIYDGIDPESTYIIYESTDDGYTLELAARDEPIAVTFTKLCQVFIVASPSLTTVHVPDNLKYEQIVWTPLADGTWEARIGTVERGCNGQALQHLNKLRNKDYENGVPK